MKPRSELLRILAQIGTKGRTASSFEDERLDFKECATSIKLSLAALADACVCFANAGGGTTVLGVRDNEGARAAALRGAPPSYSLDIVRKGIFDRTQPPLTVFADEHYEDGVRLILIDVPQGVFFHSNRSGLATRRLGTDCVPFTPEQQRQALVARGQLDWSSQTIELSPSDLAREEIARLRRLLVSAGKEDLARLRDLPLMKSLHLTDQSGAVSRAAAILLAPQEALAEVVPNYGYSYQFRPTPGTEATTRLRGRRPLLAAAEELIQAVAARTVVHPLNVAGGVQLQLVDYPQAAVREVLVNALVHRAYDVPGTVDIEHAPGRLAVTSPGGLVPGVNPENILTHPSTPRNRLLFEVVAACQLAERTGQGIDRVYREMLRMGKQPPRFEDNGFVARAMLEGGIGNDAFVRFVNDLPDDLAKDVEVLLTLNALRSSKSINAARLAELVQRTPAEAQEVLARLASETNSMLEATRSTATRPFPAYVLRSEPLAGMGRALSYTRRTPDQIDAKVVEHVSEYGFITNRTLQRLFDVHVFAARDILSDLRARGILRKVGKARGGRGVKYEPGPNFKSDKARIDRRDQTQDELWSDSSQ